MVQSRVKVLLAVVLVCLTYEIINIHVLQLSEKMNVSFARYKLWTSMRDGWKDVPSLELALRMNSNPTFVQLYKTWFITSLKLFWPEERLNITLILDDDREDDHKTGESLKNMWPRPKIAYLKPGNASVYKNQRQRMYLSYFYPEEYVSAQYVGFVDSDTMFTTVVTPQILFVDGRPTIQAIVGEPFWQEGWECWSDVTEYMIGKKEALQCMTYFPVVFKVEHIIELRKFVEKRFGIPFEEVFRKSLEFENIHFKTAFPLLNDCVCQFSIFCNYVWYYHREEYDFHLQMAPSDKWNGDRRRESQQTVAYIKSIDPKYKIPKPRMAIHARHYKENGMFHSGSLDLTKEPYNSHMKYRVQEGFCNTIGKYQCPEKCRNFNESALQLSLYSFELHDWVWDNRCLVEQYKHQRDVKEMLMYDKLQGKRTFNFKGCSVVFQKNFPNI